MSSGVDSAQVLLPCAIIVNVTGSRAVDGADSGFFNIVIVADPSKLLDYEVGSLADYITMMALSQPSVARPRGVEPLLQD